MKRLLIIASFAIATVMVVVSFMTAKTYTQLIVASAIYPAIAYLGFKLLSDTKSKMRPRKQMVSIQPKSSSERKPEKGGVEIVDIDKRAFLKLIGGAGIIIGVIFLVIFRGEKPEDLGEGE